MKNFRPGCIHLLFTGLFILQGLNAAAQSIRIEVKADSLFINTKNVYTREHLVAAIGQPDRVFEKYNTILTYDQLGLRIYCNKIDGTLKVITADLTRDSYDFSPKKEFPGTMIICGKTVTRQSSITELMKIKEIDLFHSVIDYYSGTTAFLSILFDLSEDKRTIDNVSFSLKTEEDEQEQRTRKPPADSSAYRPGL